MINLREFVENYLSENGDSIEDIVYIRIEDKYEGNNIDILDEFEADDPYHHGIVELPQCTIWTKDRVYRDITPRDPSRGD